MYLMASLNMSEFLDSGRWYTDRDGARYQQLAAHFLDAIQDGRLAAGRQLPAEREIADMSGVSRVTVRKAMDVLAGKGAVEQRQGAGSFVLGVEEAPRVEQTLSTLTSFTEYMEQRGLESTSRVLSRGIYAPTPDESVALGLGSGEQVTRIRRLRFADNVPLAVESSSLPTDILDTPEAVTRSLYSVLRDKDRAPVRAIQRLGAANIGEDDADLMDLPTGRAVLVIERTGYLANGRPIEWSRGLYRSDVYNFVAELRLSNSATSNSPGA